MAPRGDKSHLKRPPGSIPEGEESEIKKPRRSERLSKTTGADKTPVSHKQQLPSPVTNETELSSEFLKDPVSTPLVGTGRFPPTSQDPHQGLSSPPEATQPFASQLIDPQAALEEEVKDELKDGVWGYLIPLDPRYKKLVLKKRSTCPRPETVESAVKGQRTGKSPLKKEEEEFEKVNGAPSGGFLIGRHPECDIVVDDQIVSNRHCLIFSENKDQDTIAVIEDLSSNGTYVKEAIIGRNRRRELEDGDEIAILNDARFIFRYPKSRRASGFLQQYDLRQKLGKGHFAEVYMCIDRTSGQRFAVKVFAKRPGLEEKSKTDGLQQEIAVLMGVNHPNVLCLKDTFNEPNAVYLVLELAPEGELFNLIVRKQKLSESETRKLFTQIFQGIKYLHDRNIVHRDIKPENILMVDDDLHAKLADFGLAKIIGEESFTTTLCGTPSYVAPEILAEHGRRKYTKAVDIWSLGVVLYICLCGFPPFSDELKSRQFPYSMSEQIKSGRFDYPSPYWDSVGDPALDLIDRMLVVDPTKRYTVDQCLNHPWLKADQPGVNDSTGGLVGGIKGLEVGRRGVARERTLLAKLNSIHEERIPAGKDSTVAVFSKNKHRMTNPSRAEPGPAHERDPQEFAEMGGKGDQALFTNEDESIYSKEDVTSQRKKKPARGRR